MVIVPVDLAYVKNLDPQRTDVFDFGEEISWAVRQVGFGFLVVEGQGQKKIIAVGKKGDLLGKARTWGQPFIQEIGFDVDRAWAAAGWFARPHLRDQNINTIERDRCRRCAAIPSFSPGVSSVPPSMN
jgi:hypothetical protein